MLRGLRMFNVSVLISDAFMAAVQNGDSWDLQFDGKVYQTVDALRVCGIRSCARPMSTPNRG